MSANIQIGVDAVADFHKQMNIDYKQRFQSCSSSFSGAAYEALSRLRVASKLALSAFQLGETKNYADLRFHLEAEETCERLEALLEGDALEYLDGAADSLYVIFGTAVTCDLPLEEAFAEVHKSNMTKRPGSHADPRLKNKGDAYVPPDLKRVLADHEARNMT